eukprot:TRINITY_DN6941_c0_g2_i1.p1 TRINITY_DN6941_c0_g2~~TRINITY_DN6941_c0_g2_i1.p1  ORF type:complete len:1223 (+),score=356.03 TRINITY_DN6941_c0_g2_i1:122-3790(+)
MAADKADPYTGTVSTMSPLSPSPPAGALAPPSGSGIKMISPVSVDLCPFDATRERSNFTIETDVIDTSGLLAMSSHSAQGIRPASASGRRQGLSGRRVIQPDELVSCDEDGPLTPPPAPFDAAKLMRLEANVAKILMLMGGGSGAQGDMDADWKRSGRRRFRSAPDDSIGDVSLPEKDDPAADRKSMSQRFASSVNGGARPSGVTSPIGQGPGGGQRSWSIANDLWGGGSGRKAGGKIEKAREASASPRGRVPSKLPTTKRGKKWDLARNTSNDLEGPRDDDRASCGSSGQQSELSASCSHKSPSPLEAGKTMEKPEKDAVHDASLSRNAVPSAALLLGRSDSCKAMGEMSEAPAEFMQDTPESAPAPMRRESSKALPAGGGGGDDAPAAADAGAGGDNRSSSTANTSHEPVAAGNRPRVSFTPSDAPPPPRLPLPETWWVTAYELVVLACCAGDSLLATYHATIQSWTVFPAVGDIVFMALSTAVCIGFVVLNHNIARLVGYRLVDDSKWEVRREYKKSWMYFDIVCLANPLDLLILPGTTMGFRILQAFRVVKIARVHSLFRSSNPLRSHRYPPLKALTWVFFLHHCIALLHMVVKRSHSRFNDYVDSLYWAVQTTTSVGYGDVSGDTVELRLFATVFMMVGSGFYAWFLGNVSAYFMAQDYMSQQRDQTKSMVLSLMTRYDIPLAVQKEAFSIYPLIVGEDAGSNFENVFSLFPPYLESKLRLQVKLHLLRKVPMFRNAESEILEEMAAQLDRFVLDPNTDVIEFGEVGQEMFFISTGVCEVLIPSGPDESFKQIAHLRDGDSFGEIALLRDTRRTAAVRTVTMCDLFMLAKDDFFQIIESHPKSRFERGILDEAERRFAALGLPATSPASDDQDQGSPEPEGEPDGFASVLDATAADRRARLVKFDDDQQIVKQDSAASVHDRVHSVSAALLNEPSETLIRGASETVTDRRSKLLSVLRNGLTRDGLTREETDTDLASPHTQQAPGSPSSPKGDFKTSSPKVGSPMGVMCASKAAARLAALRKSSKANLDARCSTGELVGSSPGTGALPASAAGENQLLHSHSETGKSLLRKTASMMSVGRGSMRRTSQGALPERPMATQSSSSGHLGKSPSANISIGKSPSGHGLTPSPLPLEASTSRGTLRAGSSPAERRLASMNRIPSALLMNPLDPGARAQGDGPDDIHLRPPRPHASSPHLTMQDGSEDGAVARSPSAILLAE